MSLLVIQIPSKPRLRARGLRQGADGDKPQSAVIEFAHVWSSDGRQVDRHGRCAPALMPKADQVVAVVGDADISWHKLLIPKAPPNRMRAALAGMMEEVLLDDAVLAHYALGPQAKPGEVGSVAVTDRRWLSSELESLELANLSIDRVVPVAWPVEPALGHFTTAGSADDSGDNVNLSWADGNGVAALSLQGGLARALLPQTLAPEVRFSATPAAAAAAEAWLGAPVSVLTENERLLEAANSPWNLRQFELLRRHKGTRALRDSWRSFLGPQWRPVRFGLVALLAVQLIGLNLWASHLNSQVADKRAEMVNLLQTSFPQVTGVLDAPLQMQREVQTLQVLAGKPGAADLEPMMLAAAAAWPVGKPPVENLRFEPGQLSLPAAEWRPEEIERFSSQMQAIGYTVTVAEGRIQLTQAGRRGSS